MDYLLFLEDDHLLNGEGYWFCRPEFGTVRQHPAGIIVWLVCKTICHKITLVVQMGHNDLFVSATHALSCYNHLEAINVMIMTHNTWPEAHNSSEILVQKIEGHINYVGRRKCLKTRHKTESSKPAWSLELGSGLIFITTHHPQQTFINMRNNILAQQ